MTGPNGCPAVINIKGENFWCVEQAGHATPGPHSQGWAHGNPDAQAIWVGSSQDDPDVAETTAREKYYPPIKPFQAGAYFGQRSYGSAGYHEWLGPGGGWSDFVPERPWEYFTEDEVGMPSIKNPMGTR